ncbi:MAG: dockerin type I repeat-containing protein [Bacteroidales bacterium]|nr:dockerin type I repeat-containing protein [Bacteroidales bacterium]
MKKNLLMLLVAAFSAIAAMAVTTDGQTYEPVNGFNLVNKWIFDRVHSGTSFTNSVVCNQRARTAVMCEGVIYVARSEEKMVIVGTDTLQQAVIHRFDVENGTPLPDLDLTLNGSPYTTFLGVASIGRDNFGHIWVAPMTSNAATQIPLYMVDTETGALTLIDRLTKGDKLERTDYLDVIGDITRESAECNVMTVGNNTSGSGCATCYRWHADQGADTFEGGFEGDTFIDFTSFYPETKMGFSLAPIVKMALGTDEESLYAGDLFYIDDFDTAPVLYDVSASVIDSFEEVPSELQPQFTANGVAEFTIDGRNMLVYARAAYDGNGRGCQANICELGEGMAIAGMQKYWQIPADSLGKVSDGGLRVHCLNIDVAEENGEEVATIFTFKAYNGMAVYKMGKNVTPGPEPGKKGDVNGDGEVNVSDVTALINKILGTAEFADAVCDINEDGQVNVSDVTALINLILG